MTELGNVIRDGIAQLAERINDADELKRAVKELFKDLSAKVMEKAPIAVAEERRSHQEFMERNGARWSRGFEALEALVVSCIEAGTTFQKDFLSYPELQTDVLLGVLLRIHARSCRTANEIVALLKNGYADAGLSRWRTLHELEVSALVIKRIGKSAATDYLVCGEVKALEGMMEYQKCAAQMKLAPYTADEIARAQLRVDGLLATYGRKAGDYTGSFGWARPHIQSGHFDKLQSFVGLEHWSHEYKWASQDVHAGHRELRAPLGMSEAIEDGLLVGSSDSGMTDPGDRTAISLARITVSS
jgi:Family of unknown function (DUF5677)